MKRPSITQESINRNYPEVEVITEETLDGKGIPYYDVPDGAVTVRGEEEDDLEMARR
jgi:hypothetical protein